MQLPKALRNTLLVLIFIWIAHAPLVDIFVDWLWFWFNKFKRDV